MGLKGEFYSFFHLPGNRSTSVRAGHCSSGTGCLAVCPICSSACLADTRGFPLGLDRRERGGRKLNFKYHLKMAFMTTTKAIYQQHF